ncbi:MAG: alpha/beta fold hydrolase [Gammaproteobacteria bacterium]|nr:alpha/beta fold hydrolase [Gammaproteobacteria bacterium]
MIHGLWMHGLPLSLLCNRLAQRCEYPAKTFSYRTVTRALPENARRLRRCIDEIDADSVHLVGHSLGGVLALQMLNLFPTDRVGRIVCLGSPLVDSSAARRLSRWRLGRKIVGRTLRNGVLEQPLISVDGNREVGVVAGSVGLGIGAVVGALESPHDGVVSVHETQLPGITAHLVLPVNHIGLIFSGKVADQAAHFLRFGEFG